MKNNALSKVITVSILITLLFINFNNKTMAQTNNVSAVLTKAQSISTNVSAIHNNQNVNIQGLATSKNGVLYKFWQYDASAQKWTILNNYSERNLISWTPTHSGQYKLVMHVKDKKSTTTGYDDYKCIVVNSLPLQLPIQAKAQAQSIATNVSSMYSNQNVNIQGLATSKNGVLYEFWQYDSSAQKWAILSNYSEKNSIAWIPTHSGQYKLVMHVKDKKSTTTGCDDYKYIVVNPLPIKAAVQGFVLDKSSVYENDTVGVKGTATSKNAVLYKFWQYDSSTGKWTSLSDYSVNSSISWKPTHSSKYKLVMHVKDSESSTTDCDDYRAIDINVAQLKAKSLGMKTDKTNVFQNDTVKILGSATSKNAVLYKFWEYDCTSKKWTLLRDYSEDPNFNWIADHTGNYNIVMHVKDKYSITSDCDDYSLLTFKVYNSTSITDFNINDDKLVLGKKYTLTANSISRNVVKYKFVLYNYQNSQSTILKDYDSTNTIDWIPSSSGNYKISAYIKDDKTTSEYSDIMEKTVTVLSGQLAYKVIVLDAGHGGYLNGCYDSGAYNESTAESTLNSILVGYIGDKLNKLGATVIYTNKQINMKYSNTAQNLQDRIDVANKVKADLFLSIHHDSSTSSSTTGVSAHYSSYRPAADNSGTYTQNDITYDSTPCQQVLNSIKLAKDLVNELGNIGFANRGISDHNLYVTEHAITTSVLLECGFMSNHNELINISNTEENQHMADSIVKAILEYFNN